MKIQIDHESCLNSGQCEYLQPEIFQLDDDDQPQVLVEGEPTEDQLAKARDAAEMCPSQSIKIVEENK